MPTNHSLTVTGSLIVRLYLWDKLQQHMPDVWSGNPSAPSDIPIIPAQEQPEEQTSEKPYIVYAFDYMPTGDLYQLQSEQLILRVISQSTASLVATSKLCMRLFNKKDETAQDINEWILNGVDHYAIGNDEYDKWIDEVKNYRFKTVSASSRGVEPVTGGEAKRLDTVVNIDLTYIEIDMGQLNSDN